jgi:imidazolonepropionase-like amidohydrolase
MRRVLASLCLAFIALSAIGQTASPPAVALVGVNVVPMDRERVLADHTLIVRDGRIAELGPAGQVNPPRDAQVVQAQGKFVIPGLAEMHGHLVGDNAALNERILLLNVLHGVTTMRIMQGHPSHLALREKTQRRELLGPRMYVAAPQLSGNSAPNPQVGAEQVTQAKQSGFDLLKIQEGLSRPTFDAIAQTADRLGIRFAGHVPADVGLQHALATRFWSIDHLDGYMEALVEPGASVPNNVGVFGAALVDQLDEARIVELVRATKAAGTAVVPTETVAWNLVTPEPIEKLFARPEFKYVPPSMVEGWRKQKQSRASQLSQAQLDRYVAVRRKLIKALYDGGVAVLLGSDAPQVLNVPGVAIVDELELMVKAGLTPYQALATGTADVAAHLGTANDAGTIAKGRRADLLIVDADPLRDIRNVRRSFGVFVGGRWLPRAEIDRRLQEMASAP